MKVRKTKKNRTWRSCQVLVHTDFENNKEKNQFLVASVLRVKVPSCMAGSDGSISRIIDENLSNHGKHKQHHRI